MNDNFYRAFEERHRGSRDLIKTRLMAYLPFVAPIAAHYPGEPAIDLGCGRGEWLEFLSATGLQTHGIDLDEGMLEACIELGLNVTQTDAIAHLATLPDQSQTIISAFHVVEHISFEQLQTLVKDALRALKPGGLLIMETPNPENIVVATRNFYQDPTHLRPIPPTLLSFLPELYGYARVKILGLQEDKSLIARENITLLNVLEGVSPDYAVIAQKAGDQKILSALDPVFAKEYGLTLENLASRYDHRINVLMSQADARAQQADARAQQADARAQQADAHAQQADAHAQQADARAQQADVRAQQADVRAQQADVRAQQADVRAQQADARAQQADARATGLEQRLIATEANAHQMAQQAHAWHQQLLQVYGSTSWKVTRPLRVIKRLISGDFAPLKRVTEATVRQSRQTLSPIAAELHRRLCKHPELRTRLGALLKKHPWLYQRLIRLIVEGETDYNTTKSIAYQPSATDDAVQTMSPRARQIYGTLKATIEQKRKRG